jgi:hypothetical protein
MPRERLLELDAPDTYGHISYPCTHRRAAVLLTLAGCAPLMALVMVLGIGLGLANDHCQ